MNPNSAAATRHLPLPPSYKALKAAGQARFSEKLGDGVVRNRISALNAWMRFLGARDNDIVGTEFDVNFVQTLERFQSYMLDVQLLKSRTVEDRLLIMRTWHAVVIELAANTELPDDFREALHEAMLRRRVTLKELASRTGITTDALRKWLAGECRPTRDAENNLKKVERALRLPSETLTKRLGFVIKRHQVTRSAKEQSRNLTGYRERVSRQQAKATRLNYLREVPNAMKEEWRQLVAHKISMTREHSSKNDVWRVKPASGASIRPDWTSLLPDGSVVPTANATWGFIGRYFSWLALERACGGAGYDSAYINSMVWILDQDSMEAYLRWQQQRSGNILHSGIPTVLQLAAMLLRPKTGWMWLNHQLAFALEKDAREICLGFEPGGMSPHALKTAWRERCEVVWSAYEKHAKFLQTHKSLRHSRDPKEPIADILMHERPLSVVMDMLAVLKKNPPWCKKTKRYAVWTRDVLLLSWMTANPLRIGHFATMTYCLDGTGNVYRATDGTWHYRCGIEDFKNSPRQYMNSPEQKYDVQLPEYVGSALDAYLLGGRPFLAGANEGDYLFLPEKFVNQSDVDITGQEVPVFRDRWSSQGMSTRLRVITAGLRDGKPGFGAHAFRHIVATDYLKRYPGAFKLVADLLCDSLETVIKEYGHTSPLDGLALHYRAAEAELGAAMGDAGGEA